MWSHRRAASSSAGRSTIGSRSTVAVPRGIEEEGEGETVGRAGVADPVGRRAVPTTGEPLEHVADVADEAPGSRGRVDPAGGGLHLESAAGVLTEEGEEPVVGVLAHPPPLVPSRRCHRIAEDTEEDEGVGREVVDEPRRGRAPVRRRFPTGWSGRPRSGRPCSGGPPVRGPEGGGDRGSARAGGFRHRTRRSWGPRSAPK